MRIMFPWICRADLFLLYKRSTERETYRLDFREPSIHIMESPGAGRSACNSRDHQSL